MQCIGVDRRRRCLQTAPLNSLQLKCSLRALTCSAARRTACSASGNASIANAVGAALPNTDDLSLEFDGKSVRVTRALRVTRSPGAPKICGSLSYKPVKSPGRCLCRLVGGDADRARGRSLMALQRWQTNASPAPTTHTALRSAHDTTQKKNRAARHTRDVASCAPKTHKPELAMTRSGASSERAMKHVSAVSTTGERQRCALAKSRLSCRFGTNLARPTGPSAIERYEREKMALSPTTP